MAKVEKVKTPKPQELSQIDFTPPTTDWMDTPTVIKPGNFCWGAKEKDLLTLGLANPRQWSPADEDWKLPEGWETTILE
jgi:hypothetical protein